MRSLVGLMLAGLALAAGANRSTQGWTWRSLHRPLHVPRTAPGAPCPVSTRASFDFAKLGLGAGIGAGPVYPTGLRQPGSILDLQYPPHATSIFAGSAWSGNKVLWFAEAGYRGPVLVRGRQVDGTHGVRFGLSRHPAPEFRIAPAHSRRLLRRGRKQPSEVRLRAPGCYAWQVDGTSFSRIVVFQARLTPTP